MEEGAARPDAAAEGEAVSRLAAIVEASGDAIISATPDGVITSWNAGAAAMFGYAPEEMIGRNVAALVPADRAGEQAPILERLARGEQVEFFDARRVRKDGTVLDVSVSVSPLRDGTGAVTGIAAVARDVSARRRSEAAAARLAAIVESSDDAIIGKTLDGVITTWNAGATAMYGYAPQEMTGHHIGELIPADRAGELAPILERLARGERVEHYETRRVRKDGTVLEVSVSISPILDSDGTVTGAASVARDITAKVRAEAGRRALEARLAQAERLETVGQLAGGIAHDFNNLLAVIVGYAGMLADDAGDNQDLRADAQQIQDAAERAGRLTRQLLIFSRRDTAQPQEVNLNDVIAQVRELLAVSLGGGVDLDIEPAAGLPPTRADRGRVEQVLLNLAVNARDAMPAGGRLRITTGIADLDEAYCAAHPDAVPGRYAELAVADTGTGMSAQVAARAFEPFFTTKPAGQGTGLGLATVHGVLTQAGGSVTVESREGAGTVFRCLFPAVSAPAVPEAGHRILIVDDDPAMLDIATRILRGAGYTVATAGSPDEALSLATADAGFDLVLSDTLSRTPGVIRADRLEELLPGVRVLHMSGDIAGDINHGRISPGDLAAIEKPFTAQALLEKVRSLLSPSQAGSL